ncbi:SDR family oxidoreductase [Protofrankia symbiont of Coriaria ruscifolia]|uniref:SDR family oxidoreductase n=1 Tax=Protofrankia symbiont of Coriaria ruscifolia TaxID=1306542 RepID=UPI0010411C37|nr:SDR family oxidoreductase [Protofrankia symbiont of Coriaria ruscifolia]
MSDIVNDDAVNDIVLITGANKGLGYETARRLGERGATVLLGARDTTAGSAAVQRLAAGGADVRFVPVDVTSDASVEKAAAEVEAGFGRLDVLVNNAGIIGGRAPVPEAGPEDFRLCYETNVFGPVRMMRAFIPLLRRSTLPRVVMVSSGMGSLAITTDPARLESGIVSLVYPSSKAALNMITTQYAKALPGFKVNAVDPGYTATDLNGRSGYKTVEQGAEIIIRMATVDADDPTGGYFDDHGIVPW